MRIAIVGAGGVGGYFGARWAAAGTDVTFLARGPHLEAIRAGGLRLLSPLGDLRLEVPVAEEAGEVGQVDAIVIATKAWQLSEAMETIGPMVGSGTVVVGLQNGVEAADVISGSVEPFRVLGGTCRIISFVEEPGVIRHVGIEPTVFLGDSSRSARGQARDLFDELTGAEGVTLHLSEDIEAEIWRKFLFFAPVSGVGSVTGVPIGSFRAIEETRSMLRAAILEVLALGQARGVALSESDVSEALAFVDAAPEDGTTSMQRDFRDGRRTELDALSGAVVRLAAGLGIEVPVHAMLYGALLPLELRARGTPIHPGP